MGERSQKPYPPHYIAPTRFLEPRILETSVPEYTIDSNFAVSEDKKGGEREPSVAGAKRRTDRRMRREALGDPL